MFKIKQQFDYQITEKKLNQDLFNQALVSDHPNLANDLYQFIMPLKVRNQIFTHIGWGQETDLNQVEQGGVIIGQVIVDGYMKYGIAYEAIPAYSASGSMKHLHFGHQTWHHMLRQIDQLEEKRGLVEQFQLIAWYHTHPKHLRVYMSDTDKKTQRLFFYKPWHFALIFNPQRKKWSVYQGANAEECTGFMIQHNYYE